MGYRITTNIINGKFNPEIPRRVKSAILMWAYQIEGFGCTFYELDHEFLDDAVIDPPHEVLNKLTSALAKADPDIMASASFTSSYVELNQILSRDYKCPVLTIDTDDDLRNMTIRSDKGVLQKLRFLVGDLEIIYSGEKIHVHPLDIEDEDTPLIDLELFADPDFLVHPRRGKNYYDLHQVAIEESKVFLNTDKAVIDLGEWDATNYAYTEIYRRSRDGVEEIHPRLLKPWWKFW